MKGAKLMVPIISVVIPCRDEGVNLEQAIESCLNSAFSAFEIIVVDYGSKDGYAEDVVKRLNHANIRMVEQEDKGVSYARNTGIREAKSEFIICLNADDKLHPAFMGKALEQLMGQSRLGFATSGYQTFGAIHYTWEAPPFHLGHLLSQNIVCCSALFRKQAWLEAGGFNESMTEGYEDWDFWISLAKRGWGAAIVADTPLSYRVAGGASDEFKHDRLVRQVANNHPDLFSEHRLYELWYDWLKDELQVRRMIRNQLGTELRMDPLVSIVIPCYNYGRYVEDAVNSCLGSTFQEFEIIVVNNGSTDPYTIEVLNRLKKPKTRVIHVQTNIGLPHGRNVGIRAARGKYILPLDADDKLRPTLIEKAFRVLEAKPELGFATVGLEYFGDTSWVWIPPVFDFNRLLSENIVCVTSLFRKQAWIAAGGYNENMIYGYEDWDFWISLCESGWPGEAIPEALLLYRRHGHSLSYDAGQRHEAIVQQIRNNHPQFY
jgi:glycosyltransferase involved in cell wall biosynthesis